MYYKIILHNVLSLILIVLVGCNSSKTESSANQRKPYLLYFNERDTLTYKKLPGLLRLKDSLADSLSIRFYKKGNISADEINLNGISYKIGPTHRYIQNQNNLKHIKRYLPKDSFDNYEILKEPWKGINIDILDVSDPDSAFIVTVDYIFNLIE
ncbi:MAG: hypothetical protein Q4G27_05335 [Flavobacteriaceae bacterium]|nr:hypothetical protein [Flavobacteriaceae bacterium]